jgi:cell division protein FtsB
LRRPANLFAALLLTALLGSSTFGSGGLLQLWHMHAEREALGEETLRLLVKNDDLRRSILHLRHSDRSLERLARERLGLVRDGEIIYRFRPRGDAGAPPAEGD